MPISHISKSSLLDQPFVAAEVRLRFLPETWRSNHSEKVTGTWFGFYTSDEIRRLSVKKISSAVAIDDLGVR